uniref:PDZ domain-containing protein n=1 Tax=Branchiostoma floridae TaxID=7739 RepID=C3Y061_BRAFL|eukprot:XP_002610417.1 hypothetical protein BRAFLDRAFT_72359 [Branchiostoma floridae]
MAGWVKVVKLERPGGTGIYGFSVIGGPGTEVPLCIGAVIEGSPADYSRQVGWHREDCPGEPPTPCRPLLGVCRAANNISYLPPHSQVQKSLEHPTVVMQLARTTQLLSPSSTGMTVAPNCKMAVRNEWVHFHAQYISDIRTKSLHNTQQQDRLLLTAIDQCMAGGRGSPVSGAENVAFLEHTHWILCWEFCHCRLKQI